MKLAIIVSTYNRIDALNAVLSALAQQTGVSAGDWEVLVPTTAPARLRASASRAGNSAFHADWTMSGMQTPASGWRPSAI